jgi:DNA-binding NtrC family response regulator
VSAPLKILIIDDDEVGGRLLQAILNPEGYTISVAHRGEQGLALAKSETPHLVILDLMLPDMSGLEVLEKLMHERPQLPVVMLTASADVKTAVRALQLGAFDYLTKPVDQDEIVLTVKRALERSELQAEVKELRRQVGQGAGLETTMGPSVQVKEIIDQVRTVAASEFSVLVLGETGTGKELVAQAIHRQSARRNKPFVALDCGAIPETLLETELFGHERGAFTGADRKKEGQFQLAEGGTFFLDEIGNLPMSLQSKLLRVLESRKVQSVGGTRVAQMDVRFVAATHSDLQARASEGVFRADLYFRLAQYTISLPPLRERTDDIPYLAQRFLEEASLELKRPVRGMAPEANDLLREHSWPGNVRELKNVIRQAVLESKELLLQRTGLKKFVGKTGAAARAKAAVGKSLREAAEEAAREAERLLICETLRTTKGNKSQAAKALQTDYKTLHVKIKNFGIRPKDFSA